MGMAQAASIIPIWLLWLLLIANPSQMPPPRSPPLLRQPKQCVATTEICNADPPGFNNETKTEEIYSIQISNRPTSCPRYRSIGLIRFRHSTVSDLRVLEGKRLDGNQWEPARKSRYLLCPFLSS